MSYCELGGWVGGWVGGWDVPLYGECRLWEGKQRQRMWLGR